MWKFDIQYELRPAGIFVFLAMQSSFLSRGLLGGDVVWELLESYQWLRREDFGVTCFGFFRHLGFVSAELAGSKTEL